MLLTSYFKHQLVLRTLKYLVLTTLLLSLVESVERVVLLPIAPTWQQHLSLWILAWPTYSGLLMPACFFAAVVATVTCFSRTQELVVMQLNMSHWRWYRSLMGTCFWVALLLVMTVGWVAPMSQQIQKDFVQTAFSQIQLPKIIPGRFNVLAIGSKKIVIYRDKDQDKGFFVQTRWGGKNEPVLLTTKKIQLEKKDNQTAITFNKGSSYTFDEKTRLKYGVSFDQSQISLDVSGRIKTKQKYMSMTMSSLWEDGSVAALKELAWQVHLSLSLMVLGTVGLMLVDYMTCRKYPTRVYLVSGAVVVIYYIALIAVRFKANSIATAAHMHMAYTLCHLLILTLSIFLVACTRLVRAQR
jgi:lipopolysaccharide export LptBFGC system permease protein LptF